MNRTALLVPIMMCLLALPAPAADEDLIRAAVVELADAARAGDAVRLREALWGPEDRSNARAAAQGIADLIAAQRAFERSARRRFGDSASVLSFGLDWLGPRLERPLAGSHVVVDGEHARLWFPGEALPARLRRDAAGRWRVVLDVVDAEARFEGTFVLSPPRPRLERLAGLLAAIQAMQKRIDAGELESAAAVESALSAQIAKVNQDYLSRRGQFFRRPPMQREPPE